VRGLIVQEKRRHHNQVTRSSTSAGGLGRGGAGCGKQKRYAGASKSHVNRRVGVRGGGGVEGSVRAVGSRMRVLSLPRQYLDALVGGTYVGGRISEWRGEWVRAGS